MAVPAVHEMFRPILEILGDGEVHYLKDMYTEVADYFHLSPEDRAALLPSGNRIVIRNRVSWAKTYLSKAGMLETVKRAHFQITERGREALADPIGTLDVSYLRRFPEFEEFYSRSAKNADKKTEKIEPKQDDESPLELLESSFEKIKNELADEILNLIMDCSPEFFERLVLELLVRMGYGGSLKEAGERIGRSGDGGIDGIIKEDRLGLGFVYIQAKRWMQGNTVGRPEIQKFVGALQGRMATKGVFITTSDFTKNAREYAAQVASSVVLVSGSELVEYMIEHDLGVTPVAEYRIKKLDGDYFEDE